MDRFSELRDKLDFGIVDLTAPDIVVGNIMSQLSKETNGVICGTVQNFDGPITSYHQNHQNVLSSIAVTLSTTQEVNIQESLGAMGEESKRFECYLFTKAHEHYKYRLFFMEYNIAHYPVKLVVEQNIVNSMNGGDRNYVFSINSRENLEEFVMNILTCKKAISVMQELIRITQANSLKQLESPSEDE